MKIKNKSALIISILTPLAVGSLSSLLSGNASGYSSLNKPPLSPPSFLFPIVWTILYVLMGISSFIIHESHSPKKEKALKLYRLQLFFNFFWSIIFFGWSLYLAAFLWLAVMILIIALMIRQFLQISPAAAFLQIPYLIWCLFAAYLNLMIYLLN
ncbi:TspO/MBR family protein [[Clostridium] symbiosum]|uniref:TspO/MBR family protein n=1 Tax=Clostridium symbiosum TaxID=1512 RepID=UPI001D05CE84|nr:TspO/MBR family protein [[Clostridium] symbiosum]MCB6609499.1 tryptophan-rich sensory protein [[Clostridium] symbiosum]MCB6929508.1 tryptophan-rich sensory protein [[Clostridium] symbiosum]